MHVHVHACVCMSHTFEFLQVDGHAFLVKQKNSLQKLSDSYVATPSSTQFNKPPAVISFFSAVNGVPVGKTKSSPSLAKPTSRSSSTTSGCAKTSRCRRWLLPRRQRYFGSLGC
mmetsp:Transcript_39013/g.69268  ORF Transcript_39013/g.69268 Transcript_39013/m.69268 type:complete len:114 (-) Transcript_39013:762-1103(-)